MPAALRWKFIGELVGSQPWRSPIVRELFLGVDEAAIYQIELADGVTDQGLQILADAAGIATIQALGVFPDRDITMKLGAAASNVAFQINGRTAPGSFLALGRTSLTAVSLSNADGAVSNVLIAIGGT